EAASKKKLWIGLIGGGAALLIALTVTLIIVFSSSKGSDQGNQAAASTTRTTERVTPQPTTASPPTTPTAKKDDPPPPSQPQVHVSAQKPWQDTMFDVQPGKQVTMKVAGTWNKGASASGPDGLPATAATDRNIVIASPSMCLIGRIGSGEP